MTTPPLVLLCVLPDLPARLLTAELEQSGFRARPAHGAEDAAAQIEAAPGKVALVVEAGTLHASAAWRDLLDACPDAALVVVSTASPATREEELVSERRGALVRDPLDLWAVDAAVRRVLALPERSPGGRRAGSGEPPHGARRA